MSLIETIAVTLLGTIWDILPIAVVIVGFQVLVIRRRIPNPKRALVGFGYVLVGMTLFLTGLEQALFPLGRLLAQQLTQPSVLSEVTAGDTTGVAWHRYFWLYLFAALIGFSTTIAEPALIAVAIKAHTVSGGTVGVWGLRIAVAIGVAAGIALGTYRIVSGTPLHYYIMAGYVIVIVQTAFAPRTIIPLAYDSGGVTTSTVTVPIVAALGLGLASSVPGRNPLLDGFGLIAFASVFPIIAVLAYAQLSARRNRKSDSK
jgi:hypothetical protein